MPVYNTGEGTRAPISAREKEKAFCRFPGGAPEVSRQSWPEGDCMKRLTDADVDWALVLAVPRRTCLLAEVPGIP